MNDFKIIIFSNNYFITNNFFTIKPDNLFTITLENHDLFIWGDPIIPKDFINILKNKPSPENLIKNVKGHFYYIIFNKNNYEIFIGNSFLSILPLYYKIFNIGIEISNNPFLLTQNGIEIEKRYILENILFNYPLFNISIIKNVFLLPTNSYIYIYKNKIKIFKHTLLENFFISNPAKIKNSIDYITDLFIEITKCYFPDDLFYISLTGGFDGRTLVSIAKYFKKNFHTYTFGTENSFDIKIAKILSQQSLINHYEIILDSNYVQKSSQINGLEFIKNSHGSASFARAHYLYSAKLISEKTKYIITGNFGSEVFRALHLTGIVINENLYNLFTSLDYDKSIKKIENSNSWNWINKDSFKNEWESLKYDLIKLPAYNNIYKKNFTINQLFYLTVFEEVFRKYFGAELINQYKYLINRTPFIDFIFFTEILKTNLSAVYSNFFEKNPFKRYKGQITYSNIIKKTYPELLKIYTDKGYKPEDFFSFKGNINIFINYLKKKFTRNNKTNDPYAVYKSFINNLKFWSEIPITNSLFNKELIIKELHKPSNNNTLYIVLSQQWFLNNFL